MLLAGRPIGAGSHTWMVLASTFRLNPPDVHCSAATLSGRSWWWSLGELTATKGSEPKAISLLTQPRKHALGPDMGVPGDMQCS